ncbi:MAG: acetyl-CoA carboxylase, carboxyltransferase subunit beta [Bacilli bacterium]|jgi:acetyl-CoA carboxylase carboxyl transferase subunit beta|nr:acetyl-CoA carboxylase, carboxyltransferase subunit beta [Bacilli bacterium]
MFNRLASKKEKAGRKNKAKINNEAKKIDIPDNLYLKCPQCKKTINKNDLSTNYYKCPYCNHHFRLKSKQRINLIFDTFKEFDDVRYESDPLKFPNYLDKIKDLQNSEEINEAVVTGNANINGINVIGIVMDSYFLMGSMGHVVGEKITRAFEKAITLKCPIVMFSASGGARMQEGMISLMQMAKTSGIVEVFNEKGGLFINVLTDPTTGGVSASFAMLADIILAEPNALIGFAGPRVIEQTIKQKLPKGFQRAEFVLEKGFIDKVVDRQDLKKMIYQLLLLHGVKK